MTQKVFTKYRKDHCMCTTCLRSGWRGIFEEGKKVIIMLDALGIWPKTVNTDGKQVITNNPNLNLTCNHIPSATTNPPSLP